MTQTRFLRKLGFAGSADARQRALSKAYGPYSYRIDTRLESNNQPGSEHFGTDHDMLLASINAALALRKTEMWKDV